MFEFSQADYVQILSNIISDERSDGSDFVGTSAALQLKINLTSKNAHLKGEYAQRWLGLPVAVRRTVKTNILTALRSTSVRRTGNCIGQCVAFVAAAELPADQWPDLIPTLIAGAAAGALGDRSSPVAANGRVAAMETIELICQELVTVILTTKTTITLYNLRYHRKKQTNKRHNN